MRPICSNHAVLNKLCNAEVMPAQLQESLVDTTQAYKRNVFVVHMFHRTSGSSQLHKELDIVDAHSPLLIWRAPIKGRADQLALLLLQLQHALLYAALHHIPAQHACLVIHHTQLRALMLPLPRTVFHLTLAGFVCAGEDASSTASPLSMLPRGDAMLYSFPASAGNSAANEHYAARVQSRRGQGPAARCM